MIVYKFEYFVLLEWLYVNRCAKSLRLCTTPCFCHKNRALYTEPRVRLESKRSPNGVQEDLPGVHKESTRSPAGVDKESIRSPQGLWKKTTWFIVDSHHYINNHPTTDYICCKWCNPAPLIGSA